MASKQIDLFSPEAAPVAAPQAPSGSGPHRYECPKRTCPVVGYLVRHETSPYGKSVRCSQCGCPMIYLGEDGAK